MDLAFFFALRFEMAAAFFLASALLLAPQALSDSSSLVGFPSLYSGPFMFPILARKEARRGLSPLFTGRFKSLPGFSRSYDLRPFSFKPPFLFLPSLRCQALTSFSSSQSWQRP